MTLVVEDLSATNSDLLPRRFLVTYFMNKLCKFETSMLSYIASQSAILYLAWLTQDYLSYDGGLVGSQKGISDAILLRKFLLNKANDYTV